MSVLDPDFAAFLERINVPGAPATFDGSPDEWRARIAQAHAPDCDFRPPDHRVMTGERVIGDTSVPVRTYTPENLEAALPTLIYLHPGGFVSGSAALSEGVARRLADQTRSYVVSVDYRLAPEAPFPAALEDVCAVVDWVGRHVDDFGGDAARIALVGESAGGNLAASTALMMRDRGLQLAAQLLICPWTNLGHEYPSQREFGQSHFLTARDLDDIRHYYLGAEPERGFSFPASPAKAACLAGVAPAIVAVAGFDPLRDDGIAYAEALTAQGVPTTVRVFETLIHPFSGMTAVSPAADRALSSLCEDLTRLVG